MRCVKECTYVCVYIVCMLTLLMTHFNKESVVPDLMSLSLAWVVLQSQVFIGRVVCLSVRGLQLFNPGKKGFTPSDCSGVTCRAATPHTRKQGQARCGLCRLSLLDGEKTEMHFFALKRQFCSFPVRARLHTHHSVVRV